MSIKERIAGWLGLKAAEPMHFDPSGAFGNGVYTTQGVQWFGDGVPVDYTRELRDLGSSSLVMVCVNWFGTTLPEAPLQVIEIDAEGKETEVVNHPLTTLLRRPNKYYTGALIWAAFAYDWFTDGNVYLRKIRNGFGDVVELWPIPSFMIEPHWPVNDPTVFIDYYEYRYGGMMEKIDPADIVHFRNGRDPRNTRKGLAPLKSGQREIYGDVKASAMNATLMANHGIVPYIVNPKDSKDSFENETEADAVKAKFQLQTTGGNAGKAIVNAVPLEVTKLAFSPKDLDLSELRMLPEERVPALLQIPPIVLGLIVGLRNSTYSNYKQAREMAYEQMIIPSQNYIADELTHQLLPDIEKKAFKSQLVQFDLTKVRVLQEDRDALVKRTALVYTSEIIDRAEALRDLGKVPKPEDEGVYYVHRAETGRVDMPSGTDPASSDGKDNVTKAEIDDAVADLKRHMKRIAA